MDKIGLSAREICSIIKMCGEQKVSNLKLGELCIEFSPQGPEETVQGPEQQQVFPLEYLEQIDEENRVNPPVTQAGMLEDQLAEDALHAQLLIDDPLAFEKTQMYEGLEQSRVTNEAI